MTSDEALNLIALYSGVSIVDRWNWRNVWRMAVQNTARDGSWCPVMAWQTLERCGW